MAIKLPHLRGWDFSTFIFPSVDDLMFEGSMKQILWKTVEACKEGNPVMPHLQTSTGENFVSVDLNIKGGNIISHILSTSKTLLMELKGASKHILTFFFSNCSMGRHFGIFCLFWSALWYSELKTWLSFHTNLSLTFGFHYCKLYSLLIMHVCIVIWILSHSQNLTWLLYLVPLH